ncbi:hypothetical protein BVG79_01115 [Ketogulonicigenium robustum]|uniref:PhnA-like protein n=1 Tax=Ketogulonicigenium robustum TaxID=92947 RepID=A0A1W6NZ76_9RHOB|nr:YrzE family protein [Ketogulonicigenium robustum]ARO14461.1 hypothetical protein BVG79_01115 [Ketogulonicigenium robustum]
MVDTRAFRDEQTTAWGAVIAGAVTVFAISMVVTMIGVGLGLGAVDVNAANPVDGVGMAFGLTSAIGLVISLAAGGFVAGRLAGRSGAIHGFLTWALTLFIAAIFSILGAATVLRGASAIVGGVASGAGQVVGAAADGAGALAGAIDGDMLPQIDLTAATRDIRGALRNTDIEALQPQNIDAAVSGARADITTAARRLAVTPGDYEAIATDLGQSLRGRVEGIANDINRDDIEAALVQNGFTQDQASDATDRAIAAFDQARNTATDAINNAEKMIADTQTRIADLQVKAQEAAAQAAAASAAAALWAGLAAIVGAVLAAFAGLYGVNSRNRARP